MPNTLTSTQQTLVSKYMAQRYDLAAVVAKLTNNYVDTEIGKGAKTITVNKFGDVTVGNYTTGTDYSPTTVSTTSDTLVLNKQKAFNFVIDATEKALSPIDLVAGFTEVAGVKMAHAIDDDLLAHYADVNASNEIGSTGSPIALTKSNVYEYFTNAKEILDAQGIPMQDRCALVEADTVKLILDSDKYTMATDLGDDAVRNATIGNMAGFRIVQCERIADVSSVKHLMFFHKDFITYALRLDPTKVETYSPEKQFGTGVKSLALYGSKVFNDTAGVTLFKDVS